MEIAGESSKVVPVSITEDEAAVYDRQIRLWGLEAQQRMRNAAILIITLKGTATETIKNIVLAGIGRLVVADPEVVSPEDLGAGFFFREEDIGKRRVEAAKSHIQNLNPLVTIETISSREALQAHGLENLINGVDLVCLTDNGRDMINTVNSVCRRLNKPFYAGGTYGLSGYIFCDLLTHEHIAPRVHSKEGIHDARASETYCTLEHALTHKWTEMKKREVKALNCATVFSILALWEFQARQGILPNDDSHAAEIQEIADAMLAAANVNPAGLASIPSEMTLAMATMSAYEFSPVCAVLGGMLGQDILKALAAREPPITNFFTFDGVTGAGSTVRMGLA